MIIHYVSGSRADFGLMNATLNGLKRNPAFDISVVVTGQHLLGGYGHTRKDIVASGIPIAADVPVELNGTDGAEMGSALAHELLGFIELWKTNRPDLVLILGDRGEMLAAALAAVHLGIHVAHIHGGERSGTLDESFRHAISKLSHFHFAATDDAAQRLAKMGEEPAQIWTIGAPGLVGLADNVARYSKEDIRKRFGLPERDHHALIIFHPVVQEAKQAVSQIEALLDVLRESGCTGVVLRPNSDAGGRDINTYLDTVSLSGNFAIKDHLERLDFLSLMASMDLMVGNSSSGIIESASFGCPCLNLGNRQQGRLRNENTVDCTSFDRDHIKHAIAQTQKKAPPFKNLYGDGRTVEHLTRILPTLDLSGKYLSKLNAY